MLQRRERPVGGSVRTSQLARGYFELGNLAAWVERAMRHPGRASPAGPMVGDEHRIRANRLHHHGLQGELVSARGHGDPVSVIYLVLRGEPRMHFQPWIWILLDETADTARLRAGEILTHDAPTGEINWKLRRHRISAIAPFGDDEVVFAIRMKRASIFEQPGRPGMIERRTRPENAHVLVDLFVGDAEIVRSPTARSFAQLIVNFSCRSVWKELLLPQPFREFALDPAIAFSVAGRVHRLLDMDDAAFGRAADAFLFFLQTSGKDYIRVMCGLRHEEVDDAEEFELLQGFFSELGIRKGNEWIEAGG